MESEREYSDLSLPELASELGVLVEEDQKMRRRARETKNWDLSVDQKNTERLKEVIARYGWPTISMVGEEGAKNAWLLAQHADHDPVFQKQCLALMEKVCQESPEDIDPGHIAYLTDRVLLAEGNKQRFGTQFKVGEDGGLELQPVESRETINERRAEYNLPPIEEQLKWAEKRISE